MYIFVEVHAFVCVCAGNDSTKQQWW